MRQEEIRGTAWELFKIVGGMGVFLVTAWLLICDYLWDWSRGDPPPAFAGCWGLTLIGFAFLCGYFGLRRWRAVRAANREPRRRDEVETIRRRKDVGDVLLIENIYPTRLMIRRAPRGGK